VSLYCYGLRSAASIMCRMMLKEMLKEHDRKVA
jgi:hypothetical protein